MNKVFKECLLEVEKIITNNSENKLQTICSTLKEKIYHYDWVGFYVLENNELVLREFVGKPTQHTNIAIGKGVCGQVAEKMEAMTVQDVTKIDNYISCGLDVKSEIVVPIIKNGKFVAQIDIDSHSPAPFTQNDNVMLNEICKLLAEKYF